MGWYYHFCPCQESRPSLSNKEVGRGNKRREMDEMRRACVNNKGYKVVDMWESERLMLNKMETLHIFSSIFKQTDVSRDDIGPSMKEHAEKNDLLPQPHRVLISNFHVKNDTLINSLFLFYLDLYKNMSLCGVNSKEMLQQVCKVSSEC